MFLQNSLRNSADLLPSKTVKTIQARAQSFKAPGSGPKGDQQIKKHLVEDLQILQNEGENLLYLNENWFPSLHLSSVRQRLPTWEITITATRKNELESTIKTDLESSRFRNY